MSSITSTLPSRTGAPALIIPLRWREPLLTLAGAVIVGIGVRLPWLTLFAGLTPYSGLAGRNGRIVVGGAAAAALLAGISLIRPHALLRLASRSIGAVLTGFSAWLLVGVVTLARREAANPMLLARVGPGLFVVLAGALLIAVSPRLRGRPLEG